VRRLPWAVWPAAFGLAFGIWAWPQVAWQFGPAPTVMVARRTSGLANLPTLTRRVADPAVVQALYADIETLPPFPRGTISCPIDFGVEWVLRFYRGSEPLLTADLQAGGCGAATLEPGGGRPRWTLTGSGPSLWRDLGRALNLSPRALRGVP
jgi:hypothetical protein